MSDYKKTVGRINSIQTMGAADGPGIRAVVFMQGCPLRCVCCHNPETWSFEEGYDMSADELCEKINRCRVYFGTDGGVTVSGGEPLMQADFLITLFSKLKNIGIHTALDTSGCMLNDTVKNLLDYTDLVILDYKYTQEKAYYQYTGCHKQNVDEFLQYLNSTDKRTWLRQVIIPGLNDTEQSVSALAELKSKYTCIEKIELLAFKKLCTVKYDKLGIPFKLKDSVEPTAQDMERLNALIN